MAEKKTGRKKASGYHLGSVDTVISVEDVNREAAGLAGEGIPLRRIAGLANNDPYVTIENLKAGYGKMEILHDFNLQVAKGQSLCLIGPNGAGKSTILHSIFGFARVFSGRILVGEGGAKEDITALGSNDKLKRAGIAYILQDKSVFPGMTVEENLWMGGYLMEKPEQAKEAAERVFAKYGRLAERRKHQAKVLSGGERRLLEIYSSRASSTWCSRSSTTCRMPRARRSSWSSRTPRRGSNSPISAMSWSRATRPWWARATTCCRTLTSAGCSWEAERPKAGSAHHSQGRILSVLR